MSTAKEVLGRQHLPERPTMVFPELLASLPAPLQPALPEPGGREGSDLSSGVEIWEFANNTGYLILGSIKIKILLFRVL